MISSAIWYIYARVNVFKDAQNYYRLVQFLVFEKTYKCFLIQNCTREIMCFSYGESPIGHVHFEQCPEAK